MNKKFLLMLIIIFYSSLYPQEVSREGLDSLYNLYVKIHSKKFQNIPLTGQEDTTVIKCGFGIAAQIFTHFNEFTESQQKILKLLYGRPSTDTSIVSPSGFFRIHFNTISNPVPEYNVNDFAKALDSSYNFEVNYLGYPPPPSDLQGGISVDSAGGDGKYDVYIVYLPGEYGETDFESEIAPNRFTTYMQVHYNFQGSGFTTHGINAARVTAAHEFHHSIQVGNYIFRQSDQFFYELTSTSMEEFVYNSINDYYGYLQDYFDHPDRAFANNTGYNLAIWNIFLKDNFGYNIIKAQWELMPSQRAIDAINTSLLNNQSSFGKELNTFGIWNYFTGNRAIPDKYFSEAANYPLINTENFEINTTLNFNSIKPTSNNHLSATTPGQETMAVILTNSDYDSGINNINRVYSASYSIFNYDSPGSIRLDSNYYELLNVEEPSLWLTSVILNGNVIKQDTTIYPPVTGNINYAYPNPFRYNFYSTNIINIPVKAPVNSSVDLYIYSSSMDLILSSSLPVGLGKDYTPVIKWNLDTAGKKIASGVYIYFTKSKNDKTTGKLVIFNE